MNNNGMLVVVSAPSGCGKDTVFKEIRKKRNDIVESVSATTRKPREGEVEGVNYFFLSEDEFKDLIENNGLLEYAVYNNCYYGTPIKGVNDAISNGKICVLILMFRVRKMLKSYILTAFRFSWFRQAGKHLSKG